MSDYIIKMSNIANNVIKSWRTKMRFFKIFLIVFFSLIGVFGITYGIMAATGYFNQEKISPENISFEKNIYPYLMIAIILILGIGILIFANFAKIKQIHNVNTNNSLYGRKEHIN